MIKHLDPNAVIPFACFVLAFILWATESPWQLWNVPLAFVGGWSTSVFIQAMKGRK